MLSFSELINELKGLKATGSVGYRDSIRGVRPPAKPQGRPTAAKPVRAAPPKPGMSPGALGGKVSTTSSSTTARPSPGALGGPAAAAAAAPKKVGPATGMSPGAMGL